MSETVELFIAARQQQHEL